MWSALLSKQTVLAMDERTPSTIQTWCHPLSLKLGFLCDDLIVNTCSCDPGPAGPLERRWRKEDLGFGHLVQVQ